MYNFIPSGVNHGVSADQGLAKTSLYPGIFRNSFPLGSLSERGCRVRRFHHDGLPGRDDFSDFCFVAIAISLKGK